MDARVQRLHEEAPLTDVHAHPSLQAYLLGYSLWDHHWTTKGLSPLGTRSDFKVLRAGGVRVVWAAHYVPEPGLFQDSRLLRLLVRLVSPAYRHGTAGSLFDRLMEMIDTLEREVAVNPDVAEVARCAADIKRITSQGKLAIVHTVEGAHILEGNEQNIERLAARGVAVLTLAHLYPNGVAAQASGVPDKYLPPAIFRYRYRKARQPLTALGRRVIRKLCALKMIVDVAHCTPEARRAVYEEVGDGRPIIASHMGVQSEFNHPYNLSVEDMRAIAASGGAVGVILMNAWLRGEREGAGLDNLVRTMLAIHDATGSWDYVMIGTDFDGYTEPPEDLPNESYLGRITERLLATGVDETDVRKIVGQNAQRILESGWR